MTGLRHHVPPIRLRLIDTVEIRFDTRLIDCYSCTTFVMNRWMSGKNVCPVPRKTTFFRMVTFYLQNKMFKRHKCVHILSAFVCFQTAVCETTSCPLPPSGAALRTQSSPYPAVGRRQMCYIVFRTTALNFGNNLHQVSTVSTFWLLML